MYVSDQLPGYKMPTLTSVNGGGGGRRLPATKSRCAICIACGSIISSSPANAHLSVSCLKRLSLDAV